MHYPKISIVTPTFNRAEYLEECILSVLNQNYPNLEYIIIDGGSTDGTIGIINKYKKHISYWISEPDNGMYHAIQKGFEKSTGEIMAWLNSDDKYQCGAFCTVGQIFSDLPDIDWIMGMPALYNSEGLCVKVSKIRRWSKSRFWLNDYKWIEQESVFWRRSLWEKVGSKVSTTYKYAADFELWCKFFKESKLFIVETPLSGFRLHGNQISIDFSKEYEVEVDSINKSFPPSSSELARYYFLRVIWAIKIFLERFNLKLTKNLAILLTFLVDRFHHFPSHIYYDFKKDKWQLC